MTANQTQDITKQVGILREFHIEPQTIATAAGFSQALYKTNLDSMVDALHAAGFEDARRVAVARVVGKKELSTPITHRNGAYLNYHLVVVSGEKVFDPLYVGQEPVSLDKYLGDAFPNEEGVCLWEQTGPGKYQRPLQ